MNYIHMCLSCGALYQSSSVCSWRRYEDCRKAQEASLKPDLISIRIKIANARMREEGGEEGGGSRFSSIQQTPAAAQRSLALHCLGAAPTPAEPFTSFTAFPDKAVPRVKCWCLLCLAARRAFMTIH